LIQYINIFTRDGKSLIFQNYGSSEVDKSILVKISNFMRDGNQSEIKSLTTDQFNYFYTFFGEIIIVACSDLDDDEVIITSHLTTVRNKFLERYKEKLKGAEWSGTRNILSKFESELDDIILSPIKVAILGMGGCGKSDLVHLICGEDVNLEYQPTINVDITNFNETEKGVNRSITLWDLAGQSNFRSLWKNLLDDTDIALLVMDSTYETLNPTKDIIRDILDNHFKGKLVIGIANYQHMPNRLTPKFIERVLSETGWDPPIKVHGMVPLPPYREKILTILRDAINKVYQ
jgi:GTPase SAR1 family protein